MRLLKNKHINFIILLSTLCFSNIALANVDDDEITDPMAHGEQAHKNHCYKCHTDEVYTRENRFVKSIDALSKQVLRCKEGSDIPWFDEDADAVVQFLNKKYYRF
ncbi:MAG: cytochrome c [Gammaproteobacteria bacterium]|nr:cytochrome c [Gammaproteobacteria bacterium]